MRFGEFILIEDISLILEEIELMLEDQSIRNEKLKRNMHINPNTGSIWRASDKLEKIKAIVSYETKVNNTNINRIWGTFSEVPKLGQRTKISTNKSTPVGVFAFPISFAIKQKMELPFKERPYFHIFKTKNQHFDVSGDSFNPKSNNINAMREKVSSEKLEAEFLEKAFEILDELVLKIENLIPKDKLDQISKEAEIDPPLTPSDIVEIAAMWATVVRDQLDRMTNRTRDSLDFKLEKIKKVISSDDLFKLPLSMKESSLETEIRYLTVFKNGNSVPQYININKENKTATINPILNNGESKVVTWKQIAQAAKWGDNESHPYVNEKKVKEVIREDLSKKFFLKELNQVILDYLDKIKEEVAHAAKAYDIEVNVPYNAKIKKVAEEYGLNAKLAIKKALAIPTKPTNTPNQFLYRVAEELAKQLVENTPKKTDWRSAWSKILRSFGITSVADTRGTGHLHASEPVQGVFLDPKDIIHISTITMVSGADNSGIRPKFPHWNTGAHSALVQVSNQKSKELEYALGQRLSNSSPLVKASFGVANKISNLNPYMYPTSSNFSKSLPFMLNLYKVLLKLSDKNVNLNYHRNTINDTQYMLDNLTNSGFKSPIVDNIKTIISTIKAKAIHGF